MLNQTSNICRCGKTKEQHYLKKWCNEKEIDGKKFKPQTIEPSEEKKGCGKRIAIGFKNCGDTSNMSLDKVYCSECENKPQNHSQETKQAGITHGTERIDESLSLSTRSSKGSDKSPDTRKGCGKVKEPEGFVCGLRGINWKSWYLCPEWKEEKHTTLSDKRDDKLMTCENCKTRYCTYEETYYKQEDVKSSVQKILAKIWSHPKIFEGIKSKSCLPLDYVEEIIKKEMGSGLYEETTSGAVE